MPLNGNDLGDAIIAAVSPLKAAIPKDAPIPQSSVDAIEKARANAIIDYIKSNALVTVTVAGGSSSGSHTGTVY